MPLSFHSIPLWLSTIAAMIAIAVSFAGLSITPDSNIYLAYEGVYCV